MKHFYTLVFSFFLFAASHAGTEYTLNMNFENTNRSFIVHLPTGFNGSMPLPVVFNLHGYGSNAAQQIFYSRMDITADANNFICVFPEGLNNSWNSGFNLPYNSSPDDVGFLSKIIDTLYTLYNVNLSRVYCCGMSNGGYQSYRMACDLENRIAAVASVTGSLTSLTALNCVLSRSVPVLEIHGTADPLVDYNGGTGYYGTEQAIEFFTDKNGCLQETDTTLAPDVDINDSSTVEKIKYSTCNDGTEVWLYKITGGGHSWPSAPIDYIYGPTNRDINASQEIWDFFNRFTLNGATGLDESISSSRISVFPNPSSDFIQIPGVQSYETSVEIFDLSEKKLQEYSVLSSQPTVDVSFLNPGFYILKVGNQLTRFIKQ